MNGSTKHTDASRQTVGREPCPKCGSKDNLARYADGHATCYGASCDYFESVTGNTGYGEEQARKRSVSVVVNNAQIPEKAVYSRIKDRRISEAICKKYGVKVENDEWGNISKHYYPYFTKVGVGYQQTGYKSRICSNKTFPTYGNTNKAGLFGQQLFEGETGRYITVTEGELDALAVSEMFDGKWPVVSLKNGAGSARRNIQDSLEFLEGFENVILCFDQDSAGRAAVEDVCDLFSPNKVKIMSMPLKDASEMLLENKVRDFTKAWWESPTYKPVGIVSPATDTSVWDNFVSRGQEEVTPFPSAFGTLNNMMNGGIAAGEITTIGALTSIGKSTMVYNLIYGMVSESNKKIGCILLESNPAETVEKLLSVHIQENISNVPMQERDYTKYKDAYDEFFSADKLHILDHQGAVDSDELFSKMRYLVKGMDCNILVLDPLQAAVTSNENGTIDDFMDRCLKLTQETGVSIIIVSHMRKPFVKEAHDVSEYDLKGSGSINQISFNTILLSRDKMAEDDYAKNCTKVQLVKCRRTGNTGDAGWLHYNANTTRLERGIDPKLKETEDYDF